MFFFKVISANIIMCCLYLANCGIETYIYKTKFKKHNLSQPMWVGKNLDDIKSYIYINKSHFCIPVMNMNVHTPQYKVHCYVPVPCTNTQYTDSCHYTLQVHMQSQPE